GVAGIGLGAGLHVRHHLIDGDLHQAPGLQGLGLNRDGQQQAGEQPQLGDQRFHCVVPPSWARLNSTSPMRFSSTMAEEVSHTTSPSWSSSASLPLCTPMYCSPSSPEVRMLREVSALN